MIDLSYVGNKIGLMKYLESFIVCDMCGGEGYYEKTEWGIDDDYQIMVRCVCSE